MRLFAYTTIVLLLFSVLSAEAQETRSAVAGSGRLTNSIVWGNKDKTGTALTIPILVSGVTVGYSCIQNWTPIEGDSTISKPPLFVSSTDFSLQELSPCMNKGNSEAVGSLGLDIDLADTTRVICRVDMGAFEFPLEPLYISLEPDTLCFDETPAKFPFKLSEVTGNPNWYAFGFDPTITDTLKGTVLPVSESFEMAMKKVLESGTYEGAIVLKNAYGCVDTFGTWIEVHPIPSATIGNNDTICKGDTATLVLKFEGDAPFTYRITGSTADSVATTDYAEVKVSPTDTAAYYFTLFKDDNSCGLTPENLKDSAEIVIKVKPEITGALTAPGPLCDGENMQVERPGVNWNDSDSTGSGWILDATDFTTMPYPVVFENDGKLLTYWVANSCGVDTLKPGVVVTVIEKPSIEIVKNDTVCVEATSGKIFFEGVKGVPTKYSVVFDSTAFTDILESSFAGVNSPISVTISRRLLPGVKYDGYVALENANGCKDTVTVSVVTDSIPTVKFGKDKEICKGNSADIDLIFTGKAPFTYRLRGYDTTHVSDTQSGNVTVTPSETTAYYIDEFHDANSCKLSPVIEVDSVVVKVYVKPDITGVQDPLDALCEGLELPLKVVESDIHGWPLGKTGEGWAITEDFKGATGKEAQAPYLVSFEDNGHYLRYWVENGCGRDSTDGVEITVHPRPSVSALSVPAAKCAGQELNETEPTIDWHGTMKVGSGWLFDGENRTMPFALADTDNGKGLRFWASNHCGFDTTASVTVTVNDKPENKEISSPIRRCAGETLDAFVPETDFHGSAHTDSGWKFGSEEKDLTYAVVYGDNGKVLKYWTENGCGADTTDGIVIRVDDKPVIVGTLAALPPICSGLNLTLVPPASDFCGSDSTGCSWMVNGVELVVPYTVTMDNDGQLISYQVTNGCGETSVTGNAVTVYPLPSVVLGKDTTICKESEAVVSFSVTAGTAPFTYRFSASSADSVSPTNKGSIRLVPEETTVYRFNSLKDNNGCMATGNELSDTMSVWVATSPFVNDFMNNLILCNGHAIGDIPVWDDKHDSIVNGGWIIDGVKITPDYPISRADSGRVLMIWGENMCGWDTSNGVLMNISDKPTVGTLAGIEAFCSGLVLTVDTPEIWNNGTSVTKMEWLLDETVFNIKQEVSHADSGSILRFYAENHCGRDTSLGQELTVYPLPEGVIDGSVAIEWGDTTNLELTFRGASPYVYRISEDVTDRTVSGQDTLIAVSPKVTTSYRITSLTDARGCHANATGLQGMAVITLLPREPFDFYISDTIHVYDGHEKRAYVYIHPADLPYTVTYDTLEAAPVNAGEYKVVATFAGTKRYEPATRTATLTIEKAPLYIELETDDRIFNGKPQPAGVIVHPKDVPVKVTYNDQDTVPVAVGEYWVVVVSMDSNYEGEASGRLRILKGRSYEIINTVELRGDNNSYFMIRRCEEFSEVKVMFFDRQGHLIYKSNEYHNDYDMRNLGAGTYYYVLTFKDEEGNKVTKRGAVTVIK